MVFDDNSNAPVGSIQLHEYLATAFRRLYRIRKQIDKDLFHFERIDIGKALVHSLAQLDLYTSLLSLRTSQIESNRYSRSTSKKP